MPKPPFLLTTAQMQRLSPHFPRSRGIPRVDDRRVLSGIIYVIRHGLQWRDAPPAYGPHKTLYNRFVRWSVRPHLRRPGGRGRPAVAADDRCHASEGASHRCQPAQKGAFPRCIGRTKGGLNAKLHAVCDGQGRPVVLLLTEGQASDHRGAALMLPRLPPANELIADRGVRQRPLQGRTRSAWHRRLHPLDALAQAAHPARPNGSTDNATASRTCSAASRTGGASPCATTDALTPSSQPSLSPQPSPSGSINES
jgi:transposase